MMTTPACVDQDESLCLAAVNNSRSFCYTGADECCATCAARRIKYLPEYCAWGDKVQNYLVYLPAIQILKLSYSKQDKINLKTVVTHFDDIFSEKMCFYVCMHVKM